MDIATVGGLALAAICCFLSIFLGGGNPIAMINIPSVIVVFGGATGAVVAAFPLAKSLGLPTLVMKAMGGLRHGSPQATLLHGAMEQTVGKLS